MNPRLPELLAERLRQPLPGPAIGARFDLGPEPEAPQGMAPGTRLNAILVLLYPHQDQWHVPLTVRPAHLPDHAGQVSLPGGAIEPGETSDAAAVREFHEELGAAGCPIALLGRLSPVYVSVSNFCIEPWVGASPVRPNFVPNPDEVAKLLEVPLAHLRDPANQGTHRRRHRGQCCVVPHFQWQTYCIWGATCRILGELVTLLGEADWQC